MVIKIASSVPGHLLSPAICMGSSCLPPLRFALLPLAVSRARIGCACIGRARRHFAFCMQHSQGRTHTHTGNCGCGSGLLWRTHPSTSAAVIIVIVIAIVVIIIVVLRSALEMGSARLHRLQRGGSSSRGCCSCKFSCANCNNCMCPLPPPLRPAALTLAA